MKQCFQLHSKEKLLTLYNYLKYLENLDKLRDNIFRENIDLFCRSWMGFFLYLIGKY